MSEWHSLVTQLAGIGRGQGVHRFRVIDSNTQRIEHFFLEPHIWGPARPMQIAALVGFPNHYPVSRQYGIATLSLSTDPERTQTVSGSIEYTPVNQETIGAGYSGETKGYINHIGAPVGYGYGPLGPYPMPNLLPAFADILVPINNRSRAVLKLAENGAEKWSAETIALFSYGNQLRLWAFQPDKSQPRPIIGFGIYDHRIQAIYCYESTDLNFLTHDTLGFLGKAFASAGVTFPEERNNSPTQLPGLSHFCLPFYGYQSSLYGYVTDPLLSIPVLMSCQYSHENEIGTLENPCVRYNLASDSQSIKVKGYGGNLSYGFPFGETAFWFGNRQDHAAAVSHKNAEYNERQAVRNAFAAPIAKSASHCPALKNKDLAAATLSLTFHLDPVILRNRLSDIVPANIGSPQYWHGNTVRLESAGEVTVTPEPGFDLYSVVIDPITEGAHTVTINDGAFVGQIISVGFYFYSKASNVTEPRTLRDRLGNPLWSATGRITGLHESALKFIWTGAGWQIAGPQVASSAKFALAINEKTLSLGTTGPLGNEYAAGSYYGHNDLGGEEIYRGMAITDTHDQEITWRNVFNAYHQPPLPPLRFSNYLDLVAENISAANSDFVPVSFTYIGRTLTDTADWLLPCKVYLWYDKVHKARAARLFAAITATETRPVGFFESEAGIDPQGVPDAARSTSGNLDAWQFGGGKRLTCDNGKVLLRGLMIVDCEQTAENLHAHGASKMLIGQEKVYVSNDGLENWIQGFDTGEITAAKWFLNPPAFPQEYTPVKYNSRDGILIDTGNDYWLELPINSMPSYDGPSVVALDRARKFYAFQCVLTEEQATILRENGTIDVPIGANDDGFFVIANDVDMRDTTNLQLDPVFSGTVTISLS